MQQLDKEGTVKTDRPVKRDALKVYTVLITVVAVLSSIAFIMVFVRAGYHVKLLEKLGFLPPTNAINYTLQSWQNCIEKLDYDADVVFFGDSITQDSDFKAHFPQYNIVNLGYGGDTLRGMNSRISMVEAVKPEKVFVMGGVNSLSDSNLAQSVEAYRQLICNLREALPNAELYIQSVLPVSKNREMAQNRARSNETIRAFNDCLRKLSKELGVVYIDLYSLYEEDGQMNPQLSTDGLHLKTEAYKLWADAIWPYMQQ